MAVWCRAVCDAVSYTHLPTGHTLLLLDATQSYHKEVERTQGEIKGAVANLLPRLRNPKETEVVIVTLPETTPVFEAERLLQDLQRAGIKNKWWVINSCLSPVSYTHLDVYKRQIYNTPSSDMFDI